MPEQLADVDRRPRRRRQQQRPQRLAVALALEGAAERQRAENAIAIHRMPAAASSTACPSLTNAKANTSTHDTAKNSVV